jgi:hypothetical protein
MRSIKRFLLITIFLSTTCAIPIYGQQENLGTTFGIPNSSPGVFWPRGSSLETLGFGRLYPNGPEFGLSNTSGGFGLKSSGVVSGVGLAERSVSVFVREELERPNKDIQRLTTAFNKERGVGFNLLRTAMSVQFRSEMQKESISQLSATQPTTQLYLLPSVDQVLKDQMPSTDAILKTAL